MTLESIGEQSGDVEVSYAVFDVDQDLLSLRSEYSIDSGITWQLAAVAGDTSSLAPGFYFVNIQSEGEVKTLNLNIAK